MDQFDSAEQADAILDALAEQLGSSGQRYELVVIGGSALLALGLTTRPTRDVDVVALLEDDRIVSPVPLPEPLVAARSRVAADFDLAEDWLNTTPASLLDFGLPQGFASRLERKLYGSSLTVHFASRIDQIHFKLYATVDQGLGKHESDLRALEPTSEELLAAARWARTHDPSDGFRVELESVLTHFGVAHGRSDP